MRQQVVGFCELYMLVMGSWSVMGGSTLASLFPSSREKISQQKSNQQPLHSEMGTSPLSPGSSGSSRTS